jgi:hypothetical protein
VTKKISSRLLPSRLRTKWWLKSFIKDLLDLDSIL